MSKITNDGLTRPGIGCFIAVPMWHHWASEGYGYRGLPSRSFMHVLFTNSLLFNANVFVINNEWMNEWVNEWNVSFVWWLGWLVTVFISFKFLPLDATQSAVYCSSKSSICPSVSLSVTLMYRGHTGWNIVYTRTSKIISRLVSLQGVRSLQTPKTCRPINSKENTPKFWLEWTSGSRGRVYNMRHHVVSNL